ncbi:MAG: uracil-DNA glycosylase [Gammaproteobacteria bacterium]|jgi:uracil-DNA glycosylase|nr:uracil-DNA glycosylase [Xanthomonadaceae bacterium]
MSAEGQLSESWQRYLGAALASAPMRGLSTFLRTEKAKGRVIHPPGPLIFNAFNRTPFEAVRVVILGQDPYHGSGQAHGLSFSVPDGVPPPPSLQNIFKEIERDLGLPRPVTGNLTPWAERGVLLLNAVLTVEAGKAGSHQGKGWEAFTDSAISALSAQRDGLVFMLWGAYAQAKGVRIDRNRHCILRAPHPSPLSAHRGFLGCGHFSAANRYLQGRGQPPMDWRL